MGIFNAVIFDWAGTVIDFGSIAPAAAFVDAFGECDVTVSLAEARAPMGLAKRDHIAAMLAESRIKTAWTEVHGHPPDQEAIDRVYEVFLPLNVASARRHATLIPGAAEAVRALRGRGLKIGSTTGYTRSIMAEVVPSAATAGFAPDTVVCSDDVAVGRPAPLAMYKCFVDLAVYPPETVIKVDDTVPGIGEGLAAGCRTVGIALSGNLVGLPESALGEMSDSERDALRQAASDELIHAGAHHVIDTVADLPQLIDRLEADAEA